MIQLLGRASSSQNHRFVSWKSNSELKIIIIDKLNFKIQINPIWEHTEYRESDEWSNIIQNPNNPIQKER